MNKQLHCSYKSERSEDGMSYMVLLKNKFGAVIATDSRDNIVIDNTVCKDDNFQKVFVSEDRKTTVGIIGFYGNEKHNLLDEVKSILLSRQNIQNRYFDLSLLVSKLDKSHILNVFINHYNNGIETYIIDIEGSKISIQKLADNAVYTAGATNYMNHSIIINDIHNIDLNTLEMKAVIAINHAIDIDTFIADRNARYDSTIGGICNWVSIDNSGNIRNNKK